MKLKPCSCGFEHYVRVHRSWWMRLVGGRTRWLYECARCGARMLLPVGWIAAEGAQRRVAPPAPAVVEAPPRAAT
jgi:hypothetical protein